MEETKELRPKAIPQVVRPKKTEKRWLPFLWRCILGAVLLPGMLIALVGPWKDTLSLGVFPWIAGILGMGCVMATARERKHVRHYLWLLPIAAALGLLILGNPISGCIAWVNELIARWNIIHDSGIRLLAGNATTWDCRVYATLNCLLFGELLGLLLRRKHTILCAILCAVALWLELLSGRVNTLSVVLMAMGLLGYAMSDDTLRVTSSGAHIWAVTLAAMVGLPLLIPGTAAPGITAFRETVRTEIHDLRYGEKLLPEGELTQANKLNGAEDAILTVQSEQSKDIYLPAFRGGTYDNGTWKPLSGAAYGESHAGMFTWLRQRGFLPQTQLGQYYALTEEASENRLEVPQSNTVEISVDKGCRENLYTPTSLESFSGKVGSTRYDRLIRSKGLVGSRSYTYTERSGVRPGELTVAADWVSDPVTEAQQQYLESEAVYRDFVYDAYTQVNSRLEPLIRELFAEDTELNGDSIFTVTTHIRKVLSENAVYTASSETPPEGVEPIAWFLTQKRAGNAAYFASAAVEAYRLYGIPARYVEGYRCAGDSLSESGEAVLTGANAHAWVEVYFDGMGWIPLDVTPGFYYDMVSLQKLVKIPENAQRTSAVLDNDQKAEDSPGGDSEEGTDSEANLEKLRVAWHVLMAIVIGALWLTVLAWAILELARLAAAAILRRKYAKADPMGRARILEGILYRFLAACGIQAGLGWNTEALDTHIASHFRDIAPGEYTRNCQLLEKSVYGMIPPEIYEERTLRGFVRKLYAAPTWKTRLRTRYAWLPVAMKG